MREGLRRPVTPRRLDRPLQVRHSAPVGDGRDWKRLADHVVDARVAAGYATRESFASALVGKVTGRTLGNLERGHSVSMSTLSNIERALGWTPGSARAVLEGGKPTSRAPAGGRVPASDRAVDAAEARIINASNEEMGTLLLEVMAVSGMTKAAVARWLVDALNMRDEHRAGDTEHAREA